MFTNKIGQYLKEVRVELGKVNWPTRQQTIRYTLVIIGVSLALAVFLGGLDYLFSFILNKFIVL
jgi:preprotein translocase subunit SecE